MANGKCICGVTMIVTGVIFLSVCLVLHFELPEFETREVKASIIVTGPDSPAYDGWVDGCNGDLPPIYQAFWFYNLTNYHDVMTTKAKPNFDKVGPYTYLECQVKKDITFSEDQNMVRFSTEYTYYWQPSMNNGTSEDDVIFSLNQEELVLATYSENGQMIYGGPLFAYYEVMAAYYNSVFPQFALNQYAIARLQTDQNDRLLPSVNNDQQQFQANWANGTEESLGESVYNLWDGVLLSQVNGNESSGISEASANLLWDPSNEYSLVNRDFDAQNLWIEAESGQSAAQASLADKFQLTTEELTIVLTWRVAAKTALVENGDFFHYINYELEGGELSNDNKVSQLSDVGGLQWATALVTGQDGHNTTNDYPPQDTKDYVNTFHLGRNLNKQAVENFFANSVTLIPSWFPSEMSYFQALDLPHTTGAAYTTKDYRDLFGPDDGFLLDKENFGKFFACEHWQHTAGFLLKVGCKSILGDIPVSTKQLKDLSNWNWNYLYDLITPAFSLPVTGLGLIDAQTVRARLWLGPLGLAGGNQTLKDWNTTMYTGNDDESLAHQIFAWEDQEYLCSRNGPECNFFEGFWPVRQNISRDDGPVSGDGTQFPPGTGLDKDAIVYVWDSDILRTVLLAWDTKVVVQGVTGYRYLIDNSTLELDPDYDQEFYTGVSNMSHLSTVSTAPIIDIMNAKLGAAFSKFPIGTSPFTPRSNETCLLPVFLTFADNYLCDGTLASTVTGLVPEFLVDTIYLVIEPVTGATIQAQKQLQYNVFLDEYYSETVYSENDYFHNLTGEAGMVLWPVAVIDEHATLDKETAQDLVILTKDIPGLAKWSLWVGVPFFSLLIIGGGVLTFLSCRSDRRNEYEALGSL